MCKLGKKELTKPIIQGGMGVGVSLGHLAGAVAKEGGMGVISTVNAGYREPDFEQHPFEANLRALRNEIVSAKRAAGGNGMVAINAMVAVNHYEETMKEAIAAGVDAVISGAGLPVKLPELVKGTGVLAAPIVSSAKSARIILKIWDKKFQVIPDFLIIEGPKAGGHLGFSREELENGTAQNTDEILEEVLRELLPYEQKYGRRIPVFVAGGVYDGKDMARLITEGASGVQIATRFIATEECDASDTYKQMMVNAKEEDITLVKSPVGLPGRALRTPMIKRLEEGIKLSPERCNLCLKACPHGSETPYCISRALIEAVKGNVEDGLFFCGANVGRINKIVTVKALMQELMQDYETEMKGILAERGVV